MFFLRTISYQKRFFFFSDSLDSTVLKYKNKKIITFFITLIIAFVDREIFTVHFGSGLDRHRAVIDHNLG